MPPEVKPKPRTSPPVNTSTLQDEDEEDEGDKIMAELQVSKHQSSSQETWTRIDTFTNTQEVWDMSEVLRDKYWAHINFRRPHQCQHLHKSIRTRALWLHQKFDLCCPLLLRMGRICYKSVIMKSILFSLGIKVINQQHKVASESVCKCHTEKCMNVICIS